MTCRCGLNGRVARRTKAIVGALLLSGFFLARASAERPTRRRPTDVAYWNGDIVVADRDAGALTIIGSDGRPIDFALGGQPIALAMRDDGGLYVVDVQLHQVLYVRRDGEDLRTMARHVVPAYPVDLVVAPSGECLITSLWSRSVSCVGFEDHAVERKWTHRLPFPPRCVCLIDEGRRVVAADAFGGRIAVLDIKDGARRAVRSVQGHNIRGLTWDESSDELVIVHQTLNGAVPTIRSRVFWGNLLGNVVRRVRLRDLEPRNAVASDRATPIGHWTIFPLGEPERAAGDPGPVVLGRDGLWAVCFSGVDEVGLFKNQKLLCRVPVGRAPSSMAMRPDGREVAVTNLFDGTVSRIDLASNVEPSTISLGEQRPLTSVERGESLFYDARLSLDGWFSCHSCHTDGFSNGQLNDNLGDGDFGAPKRVLSLGGVSQTGPWSWLGQRTDLREQIHASIVSTMQGPEPTEQVETDLLAYLRSLRPPPGTGRFAPAPASTVELGKSLFRSLGCRDCHRPDRYTSDGVYEVPFRDALDRRSFNPPSLRGVSQRARLLHDNRAESLRSVLTQHAHGGADRLPPDDLNALLAFLRQL